jgi:hypothetical protein
MPTHEVQAGEHLSGIAALYGFSNVDTIWNDPKNADLKQQRPDPNILAAGDQVFIPQKIPKRESISTGASHTFKVKQPKLRLRLALLDFLGNPIVGQDVQLDVEGNSAVGTDDNGVIELDVAATATKATVTYVGGIFELEIGHLDPVEVDSGVRGRLGNLGYLVLQEGDESDDDSGDASGQDDDTGADDEGGGAAPKSTEGAPKPDDGASDDGASDDGTSDDGASDDEPKETPEEEALRLALQDFQVDNDLDVTGKLDQTTRDKIRDVHGC